MSSSRNPRSKVSILYEYRSVSYTYLVAIQYIYTHIHSYIHYYSGEEGEAASTLPPIIAANIHIPANLTLSASCFMLDAGCTRYAAGEGAVYTRSVEVNSKLFHLEGRSRATRKRILREELAGLHAAIEQLQQVSQQRQLRENERKVRFQALQQQQLQQQLHLQQQTVLAAQQQHQMLLKMIDEQAHQRNGTAAAPAAKKSKPKAPKIPVRGSLS